jgi:hypothetical protein
VTSAQGHRVALALAVGGAQSRAAAALFPEAELLALTASEMRPSEPFRGALFSALGALRAGARVGLVVPLVVARPAEAGGAPPDCLIAVTDHINASLRSPLCGRWPAAVPRSFPALAGIYQPDFVRARGGPRVYSAEVVAGVSDATHLTEFEAGVVGSNGIRVVSDTLVPAAIIAAHYGLTLAACGVPQADDRDNERGWS